MGILLKVVVVLGRLLLKLLRPFFNKYVKAILVALLRPIWARVGRPIWRRTGLPIWRRVWDEAPRRVKVRKQFDTLADCPRCGALARHRVDRVGTIVMLLKVIPGPSVGVSRLRAKCLACDHERPVADERREVTVAAAVAAAPTAQAPANPT